MDIAHLFCAVVMHKSEVIKQVFMFYYGSDFPQLYNTNKMENEKNESRKVIIQNNIF